MQSVLQAISNPRRRKILQLVWDDELPARAIAAQIDVSWSAVSQNLRLLNQAGLITERRVGTQRFYRADREALAPIEVILQAMWDEDLQRLKNVVERDKDTHP